MTKEEIFNKLKSSIRTLHQKSKELADNPSFSQNWGKLNSGVETAIYKLSKEDQDWVATKYKEWYQIEIVFNHTPEQKDLVKVLDENEN